MIVLQSHSAHLLIQPRFASTFQNRMDLVPNWFPFQMEDQLEIKFMTISSIVSGRHDKKSFIMCQCLKQIYAKIRNVYFPSILCCRAENPGFLVSWGILNPAWQNFVGSKLGPNLYRSINLKNNLFWGAGCPGTNTFNSTSLCWRSTQAQVSKCLNLVK